MECSDLFIYFCTHKSKQKNTNYETAEVSDSSLIRLGKKFSLTTMASHFFTDLERARRR